MEKVARLSGKERKELFSATAAKKGVIDALIEKDFWVCMVLKATILHQIAYFPESKPVAQRSSRHYYDVFQMAGSSLKVKALDDLKLLQNVAEFKKVFYRSPAARYDLSKPGTFKLVPSAYKQKLLSEDYERMREMIFGKIPDFSEIIQTLETLESEINNRRQHV